MSPPNPPSVASPCIKVCQLNAERTCIGCGRTLQEIACWSSGNAAMRSAIAKRADQRLRALQGDCPIPTGEAALTV